MDGAWLANQVEDNRGHPRVVACRGLGAAAAADDAVQAAWRRFSGADPSAEHAAEARRLGSDAAYRLRLVNALLGATQAKALVAESLPVSADDRLAAYEQQFATAGVG